MNRFQVLTLLFPAMFTVRQRRFHVFNCDVSDGPLGKRIRREAKMILRINIAMVLSYLWQHCVLETAQVVGTEFPEKQCEDDFDCFASQFHWLTLVNRNYQRVDCSDPERRFFEERMVIGCVRFVTPTWTG